MCIKIQLLYRFSPDYDNIILIVHNRDNSRRTKVKFFLDLLDLLHILRELSYHWQDVHRSRSPSSLSCRLLIFQQWSIVNTVLVTALCNSLFYVQSNSSLFYYTKSIFPRELQ